MLSQNFNYSVTAYEAGDSTSWSNDSANLTITITGVNDAPVANNDSGSVNENAATNGGSVVANDTDIDRLDTKSFVAWADGSGTRTLDNAAGATATLNADGTWVLDAQSADALSAGEALSQSFIYTMSDNHGATSTATLTVTVHGANDAPVAGSDDAGRVAEDGVLLGSVSANDSDVDSLDTHSFALVDGSFNGAGQLTLNADGTFSYDPQGAYNHLNNGESVALSFQYTMTDNHGATSTATVTFNVDGVGVITPPPPPPPPAGDYFPSWGQDISHVVLVFAPTAGDVAHVKTPADGYYTVKLDNWGNNLPRDLDSIIETVLSDLKAQDGELLGTGGNLLMLPEDTDLLGVIIKGGLQTTSFYAYGEYDSNGSAADPLPAGIALGLPGGHANESPQNQIDFVVDIGVVGVYTSL